MITALIPRLTEQNYESFRAILSDAPKTHKEWVFHVSIKATDLSSKGFKVESVDVDAYEFKRYCKTTESSCDLRSLDNFAFKKSDG